MMPRSKIINHDVLAREGFHDLVTCPNMRIKVGCISRDIRIVGRIVGVRSTEQSVWHLVIQIVNNFNIRRQRHGWIQRCGRT